MRHACAFPRRALAGPSRKSAALQNCNRVRDKVIRDTSADKRKPGDPLFFLMVQHCHPGIFQIVVDSIRCPITLPSLLT